MNKSILYITFLFFCGIVAVWILYCDYETKKYESVKKLQDLSDIIKHNKSTIDSIGSPPQPCFCSDSVWRDSLRKTIIEKRKREINKNN